MKILISSKHLAAELNKIDFDNDHINSIKAKGFSIYVLTNYQSIEIPVEIIEHEPDVLQSDRRWDWVKKLVNQVDEQPIVLDISERIVNVIFQY